MKKTLLFLFAAVLTTLSFAQQPNEVRGSMGIDFISVPKLKIYLESNFTGPLSTFSSAVNFSGSYGRMISPTSQVELEVGYLLNSYNGTTSNGNYDLTYSLIMPSLLYNYVITGTGYNFKVGGGAGLRFLSITEKQLPFDTNISSLGFGLILRTVGNTAIAENVFAHIGADIRYDFLGKPDENTNNNYIGNTDFSSLSFGVRLGISYQF